MTGKNPVEEHAQQEQTEFDGNLIMVVDDDRDVVAKIVQYLGEELPSARLVQASNGNDALSVFHKETPNPGIVILDMMLPGRSGFLVMEKLKRRRKASDPPHIIMITANQNPRHRAYAGMLGTFEYLTKPFRMERLLEVVLDAKSRIS